MKAIWFDKHLYQPLLYLDTSIVEISPAPLNRGERQFVEDLNAFHDGHPDFFATRELYLLRNLSKGRGVGFFEAGNFIGLHPLALRAASSKSYSWTQRNPEPWAERS
jgi:hypothetical protein